MSNHWPKIALLFVSVALLGWLGCSDDAPPTAAVDASAADESTQDVDAAEEDSGTLCEPDSRLCSSATTVVICSGDGSTRVQQECEDGLGCLDGECAPIICDPRSIMGCVGNALEMCNFSGTAWEFQECPAYWTCEINQCVEPPCLPGELRCDGLDRILTCDPATGVFVVAEQCADGEGCYEDICQPLCEINRKVRDYVGCEYFTVDLDNLEDAEVIEHTVVLSNPSEEVDADIEVVDPSGFELEFEDSTVPAGGQLVLRFPFDRGLIRAGITDYSWRITSSVPVTAHQFNPLNNFEPFPFSNDGTLLLPTHAVSERYYVLSWVHRAHELEPINGFATIVAVNPDGAELLVRSSTNALVGDGQPNMTPGEERSFSLEYGQTLTLQTAGADDDLTGTYVESEETDIMVFGGHECANVILGIDRCDHIETQLLPISLLRERYVAVKFETRVPEGVRSEPDYWRVLAVDGATMISTDPEIVGVHGSIIATGEWFEFGHTGDFEIWGDRPFAVAHYMVGANWTGIPQDCLDDFPATGIGDPAMTQLIPTDQYRDNYIVLTPFAYERDYLNIAVPTTAAASVRLDGELLSADIFSPVGSGQYSAARISVVDGSHTVSADEPFGLDAYGYSCHVSYAYPGGLRLEELEE